MCIPPEVGSLCNLLVYMSIWLLKAEKLIQLNFKTLFCQKTIFY